jgi:hypothetical protein
VLEEGGPEMRDRFMAELREEHLGLPPGGRFEPGDGSVAAELRAAYEGVLAAQRRRFQRWDLDVQVPQGAHRG